MASGIEAVLALLQSQHDSIKLHTAESPDYEPLRKSYIVTSARPSVIARPQTAEDVQTLVRACVQHGVDFNIRTGGHNCAGRTLVDNALLIDMRDIAYVKIGEDKNTAKVGGGVLSGALLKVLGEEGLITPCGSIASVGYVGWSTYGGYGPFSTLHGLGVDQIVSAKLVDSKGDIVVASDELLKGIRGAGGIFGVIVELTIKVFPLKEMLVGTLIYDSSDMTSTWTSLAVGLSNLSLPAALGIQIFSMEFPQLGKAVAAIATWVDDDHEEGRKWIDKVASLGTCIVNMTEAKTAAKYGEDNEKMVTYGVHGRSYTLNVKTWTPQSLSLLAKYSQAVPGGNAMIAIHSLRSPRSSEESVFGAREDHHVVEIVSMTADPESKAEASKWGQDMLREFREQDSGNILDSAFISLLDYNDADLEKIYHKHLETVVGLKRKYDPENVFKHSMPKIVL